MAAVLASGPDAVVSHESAGALWGLLPSEREKEPVHVTTMGADRGRRPGICPHRVAVLPDTERAFVVGVPVTSPARTLVDLAVRLRPRRLEQAMAEAERRDLTDRTEVAALLDCGPLRKGATTLRSLLAIENRPAFTRSSAEERFLALTRKGGLPVPAVNEKVGTTEVDFLWRSEGVTVEVDGFAYHSSRGTFEKDRRRDARLAARGFQVVRVTWRQLTEEPHSVLVRLAQILALARAKGEGP
jgi:very-short-patch-repair endonuclease